MKWIKITELPGILQLGHTLVSSFPRSPWRMNGDSYTQQLPWFMRNFKKRRFDVKSGRAEFMAYLGD